ncbi:MAG: glutathione S-transferase N-terminal domain-containing protein [Pseudomonadota bacterium]
MLQPKQLVQPQNLKPGDSQSVGLEAYTYGESLCSQKLRVALAEKELPYKSHHIYICDVAQECQNLSPDYLKINPKGIVPTLVHDGERLFDAHKIIKYLDQTFPDHGARLWPSDPKKAEVAQFWFEHGMLPNQRSESRNFASAIATVTLPLLAHMLRRQPLDHVVERYKKHPLPERGALFTSLRTGERAAPPAILDAALDLIAEGLNSIEEQLKDNGGPYVLGDFSMVDITMMACFHRLEDVRLDSVFGHASLSALNQYWPRLQHRPSYKAAITNWHDEENWRSAIDEVFGEAPSPHLETLKKKIDGR